MVPVDNAYPLHGRPAMPDAVLCGGDLDVDLSISGSCGCCGIIELDITIHCTKCGYTHHVAPGVPTGLGDLEPLMKDHLNALPNHHPDLQQ